MSAAENRRRPPGSPELLTAAGAVHEFVVHLAEISGGRGRLPRGVRGSVARVLHVRDDPVDRLRRRGDPRRHASSTHAGCIRFLGGTAVVHGQVLQLVPRRVRPILGRERGVSHVRQPGPAASSAQEPRQGGQEQEKQQDTAEHQDPDRNHQACAGFLLSLFRLRGLGSGLFALIVRGFRGRFLWLRRLLAGRLIGLAGGVLTGLVAGLGGVLRGGGNAGGGLESHPPTPWK